MIITLLNSNFIFLRTMNRQILTGGLLSLLLAINACTNTSLENETGTSTFLPPLMGWSSWNTYHVNINEELIKKQADALVATGLKDAGYTNINVDDGFFGHRDETGKMHAHPERFPNGMRVVSDYIHSLGLKAGIYSDAGDNTCGSIYDDDPNGVGAGLYGHEQQDMDLYLKEWNYDFIKIDYCGAKELGLDEEKRYTAICEAIKNTGRTDVSINICRWAFPGTWAKRLARSWRISPDIRPNWASVKHIIEKNLYLSAYAGKGHYNDMDMLEVGRGMSSIEDETHFGMWCIMSSPLLIGCDLTTIPDTALALLKNPELIALNQDPLGLQAYVVQREREAYVLVKDIKEKRETMRAVAFYNASDSVHTFRIALKDLELGGKVKVRDVMKRTDMEEIEDEYACTVPAHGVFICRMEAEQRLEPERYEAEWAYLPCFDDLGKQPKPVLYLASSQCSGGMKVFRLGGREENYAEWPEVYSEEGGSYEMTIRYCSPLPRKLEVWVNGTLHELPGLTSGGSDVVSEVILPITLTAGNNVVRMGNRYGWAPDIDCFLLKQVEH